MLHAFINLHGVCVVHLGLIKSGAYAPPPPTTGAVWMCH